MQGFFYHLKLEGLSLWGRTGKRAVAVHLALIAVFGILLPGWKGADFFDPVMLSAYACMGILFAAPAAAEAFRQIRPVTFSEGLARVAVAVIYAEILTATILVFGMATVYLRTPVLIPPDLETLAMVGGFGIAASAALAAVAGWLTLRFSAGVARGALRILFLGLLLVFFYRSRWLPDVAGTGTLIALVVGAGASAAMRRTLAQSP